MCKVISSKAQYPLLGIAQLEISFTIFTSQASYNKREGEMEGKSKEGGTVGGREKVREMESERHTEMGRETDRDKEGDREQ